MAGIIFKAHVDYGAVANGFRGCPNTAILPRILGAIVFYLIFRDVVCVWIERVEHGIDTMACSNVGVDVIHIKRIHFAKKRTEYFKIFGEFEKSIARGSEET